MSGRRIFAGAMLVALACTVSAAAPTSNAEQNRAMLQRLQAAHELSPAQMKRIESIFAGAFAMGQGNPAIARHPMTPAQCREKFERNLADYENPEFERICGGKYMAPLYDPQTATPQQAKACIDQFEFPDMPCEYPVIWVKAREAAEICAAQGKRLCDAHEWEGACQGRL